MEYTSARNFPLEEHTLPHEKSTTTPAFPGEAEERTPLSQNLPHLLLLHYCKHPKQLHPGVAQSLQRGVRSTQRTIGTSATKDVYQKLHRGLTISRGSTHPNHGLFSHPPSGRRYRTLCACTSRLRTASSLELLTSWIVDLLNAELFSFTTLTPPTSPNPNMPLYLPYIYDVYYAQLHFST